ncbi:MAG: xylose isomerase [Candidatus Dormibacteria bacterium]
MTDQFGPSPADHFTFGLWTVGHTGRDPFGLETRPPLDPVEAVHRLSDLGAYGVNFHDDDLIPFGSSPSERARILARFRAATEETGIRVPMVTTNLFTQPIFKDGAFTANEREVRRFALRKVMDAIDLGVSFGAETFVFWGGREGTEVDASKNPLDALDRFREAIDFLCDYVVASGYNLRFALEAKPNEPRGDIFLATTGHMLAFIEGLARPEMVGVNPELAHETMAGLAFHHGVAQALWAGKLFHIDLNAQRPGRFDQDLRFGSEDIKGAFYLVRLLQREGYAGMRHFDAHAYRTENQDGVWDFALGCMRTYKMLEAATRAFDADPAVQAVLAEIGSEALAQSTLDPSETPKDLRATALPEVAALGRRPLLRERLDQMVIEHILGVR